MDAIIEPLADDSKSWNRAVVESLETLKPLAHDNNRNKLLAAIRHVLMENETDCCDKRDVATVVVSCAAIMSTLAPTHYELADMLNRLETCLAIRHSEIRNNPDHPNERK